MKALVKTLVGDVRNVSAVALIIAAEVGLVQSGHTDAAAFVIPVLTLGSVAWLAGPIGRQG